MQEARRCMLSLPRQVDVGIMKKIKKSTSDDDE